MNEQQAKKLNNLDLFQHNQNEDKNKIKNINNGNFFYLDNNKNSKSKYSVSDIKLLGSNKSEENLNLLLKLYTSENNIDIKREIISSIGRQNDNEVIFNFIVSNVYNCYYMDCVYQMYRTCLYKSKNNTKFETLANDIETFFDNEFIYKMKSYYNYRQSKNKNKSENKRSNSNFKLNKPTLLEGNNLETLKQIQDQQVQLIFTSPPYYNARVYSNYRSYNDYLSQMKKTLTECFRILENGRFIIINVSPVITKRAGREFESIRYPIHFDFHKILVESGFYFIDEIQWIKPEATVTNRNGGYQQTRMPLSYKPNCITESIMVYRKNANFLLDKNIAKYDKTFANVESEPIETSNCWYISPCANKEHPAVFPEELCKKILQYYSFKNDIVLDPFAGSGTFGKVAFNMRRIPILCEISEEYCKIIKKQGIYNSYI